MKTVFITGASSGIGQATALFFAKNGWRVAATMRNPEPHRQWADAAGIRLYRLDVTDEESIREAVAATLREHGQVDVVVNNAGYGALGAFEAASDAQIKRQFDTNVFGLMNVCRAWLPHFRAQKKGVFVQLSSMAGRATFPVFSVYHATKWAVEGFSESLQFELRPFGIRVKIIEPGAIRTDFYTRSQEIFRKEGLDAYDSYTQKILEKINSTGRKARGPESVARTIYRAATDNRAKMRYPVGGGAPALLFVRRILPRSWYAALVRAILER